MKKYKIILIIVVTLLLILPNVLNASTKSVTLKSGVYVNDAIKDVSEVSIKKIVIDEWNDSYNTKYGFVWNSEDSGIVIDNYNKGTIKVFCSEDTVYMLHETNSTIYMNSSAAGMFSGFSSLEKIVGLQTINTSKATDMGYMFSGCKSLISLNLSKFNTSNVTLMDGMFDGCENLTKLDLSSFNTSKVLDMGHMFYECKNLTKLDLSSFNTSKVTSMQSMFYECKNLTKLDLSSFNTSKVTSMERMFYGCESLTSLNLLKFNTSKVTNMSYMFTGCENLTKLDLSSFNTSKVTNMESMFYGCENLVNLNLSSFNTDSLKDGTSEYDGESALMYMFSRCENLKTLDLSGFNTANVRYMDGMFEGCENLKTIKVNPNKFTTKNVIESYDMFYGCTSLVGGKGTKYTLDHIGKLYARVDTSSTKGYFTSSVVGFTSPTIKLYGYGYNYNYISWGKVTGATGYKVYRSTSEKGTYTLVKTMSDGSTLKYKDTNVTIGKTYYYKVKAVKSGKISSYSNIISNKVRPKRVTFSVKENTSTSLKMTWDKVSGATKYIVYKCTGTSLSTCKSYKSTTGTTMTISGLQANNKYYLTVRAVRTVNGNSYYGDRRTPVAKTVKGAQIEL